MILVSPLQLKNAELPILFKLVQLLKSTSVSPLQPANASPPILVKLVQLLKSTSVSPLQEENAYGFISVAPISNLCAVRESLATDGANAIKSSPYT